MKPMGGEAEVGGGRGRGVKGECRRKCHHELTLFVSYPTVEYNMATVPSSLGTKW